MIQALIAPLLAEGLNLLGNAAIVKGKEWVEQKTGVKLDGPLSDADKTKLRQFEMEHEEELQRLRIEDKRLDIDAMQIEVEDRDSARDREMEIATSQHAPYINKVITPYLAIGTVALSFILFGVLIFMEVRPEAKDILIYVLGTLSSALTMVLSYYFGSSQSSAKKTEIMEMYRK